MSAEQTKKPRKRKTDTCQGCGDERRQHADEPGFYDSPGDRSCQVIGCNCEGFR